MKEFIQLFGSFGAAFCFILFLLGMLAGSDESLHGDCSTIHNAPGKWGIVLLPVTASVRAGCHFELWMEK